MLLFCLFYSNQNDNEEENTDFIVVMDVHRDWCGPCTVLEPTFNQLYLGLDQELERNVAFVSVSAEKLRTWLEEVSSSGKKDESEK